MIKSCATGVKALQLGFSGERASGGQFVITAAAFQLGMSESTKQVFGIRCAALGPILIEAAALAAAGLLPAFCLLLCWFHVLPTWFRSLVNAKHKTCFNLKDQNTCFHK